MSDLERDLLVEDSGESLHGVCGHCQRVVTNYDPLHRVSAISRGGRGVECSLRGDIEAHEGGSLADHTEGET